MSTAATGAARPAPVPRARPRSLKDMLAVNFGNALEWYDWNVYTIFAPVFAAQIFHADNPTSELLATLAVFAVGFVARPHRRLRVRRLRGPGGQQEAALGHPGVDRVVLRRADLLRDR